MKYDIATKEYFSDNVRFADVINYYLFEGREVVKENQLRSLDTGYATLDVERIRDIVKEATYTMKTDGVMDYIIVGIENQTKIDYGMVVRTLLYDGLAYDRQMKEIKQGRRNERSYYGYLRKTDCLNPVVTIVIYYGEEKWDGKKNLRDLVKCPIELKKYIPEYELHLLEVHQLKEEEIERFHTDIAKAFQFFQASKNRERMKELLQRDEYYKKVDVDTAKFISSMTNLEIKIKGRESIDMCEAFKQEKELGRQEGIILGIEQGRAEGLETGIEKGRAEGRQEGLETGRAEGATQREKEIVRNLYSNHIDIETIMRVTSLSEEEVRKIIIC